MMEKQLIDTLFEAYNAHDVAAVANLYADDGMHVDVATGKPKTGRKAIADGLTAFLAAFPDAQWRIDAVATSRNRAFARYVLRGGLASDVWAFEARGQRLELYGVLVLECERGAILRSEDYWDSGTFQRQMAARLSS